MKKFSGFLLITAALVSAVFLGATAGYAAITHDAVLDEKKLVLSDDKIEIFDKYDEAVHTSSPVVPHENFRLKTLPEQTKWAFIDTEDKDFYKHHGFAYKRMLKAAWENLKSRSFREGASTISQQLIKNTHLSQEKTIRRKLREFKLTKELEKRYSKDQILEKYLNTIYFGHSCFGLQSAARFYFGKEPADLSLSDSAILAGLVRSPNNYSPFRHPENCLSRKKTVLKAMRKQGHIDAGEEAEALKTPLPETPSISGFDRSYSDRVFDELESLAERYSFTIGGTLRIYTWLDPDTQSFLESLGEMSETDKTYAVLDNATHGFKAYYSTAGAIRRLPGSLIKPLMVYGPAVEENIIAPATPVLDEKTDFGGYSPKNFGDTYNGYVSARECLARSLNVPAVKILNSVGVEKAARYMQKMGLEIPEEDYSLALALGGMKNGFSLGDLLAAYSVFPGGGEYQPAGFIREIVIDGFTAYKRVFRPTRVFSEETAYLVNDMMKTAVKTGTAKKLRFLPFDISAKTGTSGTEKGNTDAYAVSCTTADVVGVWLGNADNSLTDLTGGGLPANILLKINEYLYRDRPPENFTRPDGIQTAELDRDEYYATHNMILADDSAPIQARLSELFKTSALPGVKSDKYTHPSISSPSLRYADGKVCIRLQEGAPDGYEYIVDRFDSVTHNTVYQGKYASCITDDNLERGKTYVYTVIPVYKGVRGKAVVLPTVTTDDRLQSVVPDTPPDIVDKNWWDY